MEISVAAAACRKATEMSPACSYCPVVVQAQCWSSLSTL